MIVVIKQVLRRFIFFVQFIGKQQQQKSIKLQYFIETRNSWKLLYIFLSHQIRKSYHYRYLHKESLETEHMQLNLSSKQIQKETNEQHSMSSHNAHEDDNDQLNRINLRELRQKNRQTEGTIKSIETKIMYMKNKQEKTVKKVLNIKRKLTSLESVRSKTKQLRDKYIEEKRKQEEQKNKKVEFNKLIKDHLKYNKKIVMTLMNHKVNEQAKHFKDKNSKLQIFNNIQKENMVEQNVQKANKVRVDHIEAHERRKMYFLQKLHQFKQLKEQKLKEQIRERQRQEQMIYELEHKQKILLQRLSVSQKFRIKCQQQYEEARRKYRSFYEASKGVARGNRSCDQSRITEDNEGKADIFIS